MVDQLANIEGLGCMDILWGIYITVVPAYFSSTGDVVHSLVAINLADSSVLGVYTFPLRFFSLEYNSISHNLHGVAKDLNGMNAFYYLCEITVAYTLVNEVELPYYTFICSPEFLSELPDYIHHNYLAQSAVEHHFNISWFSYKKIPWDDEIFIHEVYHDTGVQERWRDESVPLGTKAINFANTAPRVILRLYPPAFTKAQFDVSGTIVYVSFDTITLRAAIPIDDNGDEFPDRWDNRDKMTRGDCARVFDDVSMKLLEDAVCQWTTDADFFIELSYKSELAPFDILRVRPGTIYAGRISAAGIPMFSLSSSDFVNVSLPDDIPVPVPVMTGTKLVDTCTAVFIDARPATATASVGRSNGGSPS
jgi:hypothetical protein